MRSVRDAAWDADTHHSVIVLYVAFFHFSAVVVTQSPIFLEDVCQGSFERASELTKEPHRAHTAHVFYRALRGLFAKKSLLSPAKWTVRFAQNASSRATRAMTELARNIQRRR